MYNNAKALGDAIKNASPKEKDECIDALVAVATHGDLNALKKDLDKHNIVSSVILSALLISLANSK